MKLSRFLWLMAVYLPCFSLWAQTAPTTNGLYAQFNTSKGTFYCSLRYDLVPRAVANFVSLADGTKQWLDYSKASLAQHPFYNGLIFHRVIQGFVIQGGSPNGLGTDDPGYTWKDEFSPTLNNDQAGVLAMANSGTNSNGSQFYITLAPQPSLDHHYTVFGSVVSGMSVVTNIGGVATDANNKPLVSVVISNVTILRIGAAASNFNANTVSPALPVPRFKAAHLTNVAPNLELLWTELPNCAYRMCYSGETRTWNGFFIGAYTGRIMNDFLATYRNQFFVTFETAIDQ